MTDDGTVIIDDDHDGPLILTGAVAYVVLTRDGVMSNGHRSNVNPRVWANALQYIIEELIAEADTRHVPPIDPGHYPRHRHD